MAVQHDYTGEERRAVAQVRVEDTSWHLDKKVPISLILALIVQAVAVIMFFADIKRDVELLKADVQGLHQTDTALKQEQKEDMKIVQGHYARLEAKLDRLIERTIK